MKNALEFLPIHLKNRYQANTALREIINAHIDVQLQQHYQVLAYRENILTIGLNNAVWRMRFQKRLLDLRATLQKHGYYVKQIFFKIIPSNSNIRKNSYIIQNQLRNTFSTSLTLILEKAAEKTNDEAIREIFLSLLKRNHAP